jgi:hypothetical protein
VQLRPHADVDAPLSAGDVRGQSGRVGSGVKQLAAGAGWRLPAPSACGRAGLQPRARPSPAAAAAPGAVDMRAAAAPAGVWGAT